MSTPPKEVAEQFTSLQWGYGAGLVECGRCFALVLPDAAIEHLKWHQSPTTQPPSAGSGMDQ